MQFHFSADGTTLDVYVPVYDWENGVFVDPDGWSANPNSASIVIQEQPSALHTGTKLGTGQYKFSFVGLTAIAANSIVNIEINGAISSVAWPEWIEQVTVARHPLHTLGGNAPAGWINSAAIGAAAFNGKGDWLTTLGANAPAGWINAAAVANDARTAIATAVEAALLNESDGQQLLAAISSQVQALFDSGTDVPVSTLVSLIRDGILNRILSGNHEIAGSVGKLLQNADAAVSTRATPAQVRTELATELAVLTTYDDMFADLAQMIQNNGTVNAQFTAKALELAPSGGGGGGSGDASQATLLEVQDTVEAIATSLAGTKAEVNNPVKGAGAIELKVGDDYLVAATTQLRIPITDVGGVLHAKLLAATSIVWGAARGRGSAQVTGTVANPAGLSYASNVLTISVEIPRANLAAAEPGFEFDWDIQYTTAGGHRVTPVVGTVTFHYDRV